MHLDLTNDFFLTDLAQGITLRTSGRIPDAADQVISSRLGAWTAIQRPGHGRRKRIGRGSVLGFQYPGSSCSTSTRIAHPRSRRQPLDYFIDCQAKSDNGVYTAQTRNLAVFYALYDLASVFKASYSKSPAGRVIPTYASILTGIPARFQPLDTTEQLLEDAEWPKTTYHVILGTDIFDPDIPVEPASADYRLVDSAGKHYRIMKYTRRSG